MSWPDLDLVPPGATEVHEIDFTGSVATFDLPALPVGSLILWLRGGRGGGCPYNLRGFGAAVPIEGTYSVIVGGDGSGTTGGFGGGGAGGSGAGGHGDGTGGGGGSFVYDPTGTVTAWVGGAGGKAGAPLSLDPSWPWQLSDLSPVNAYGAYLGGQNFAVGASGWFAGQGGNMNPDRSYPDQPGSGAAETFEGWELTATEDPGFGGAYGQSSYDGTISGLPVGFGGDGATLDGFDGPGGGGGGGGLVGGGGGGAVNWANPFVGASVDLALGWGIGPGGHGATDLNAFVPSYGGSARNALVAAGVPLIDGSIDFEHGKVLVYFLEGEPPATRGGWGLGIKVG